jgi:hypothetical protein
MQEAKFFSLYINIIGILRKVISLAYISISNNSSKVREPNNEVIPSKEFIYQLKSQTMSGIRNEREICYTHFDKSMEMTPLHFFLSFPIVLFVKFLHDG